MTRSLTRLARGLLICCSLVLALATGLFVMRAAGRQGTKPAPVSLSPDQVVASVRTAVTAKPGNVRALEAEKERGKILCEVEILAQDGKTYEVVVDVENNSVVEIEDEDDDDDDDDDNDNKS